MKTRLEKWSLQWRPGQLCSPLGRLLPGSSSSSTVNSSCPLHLHHREQKVQVEGFPRALLFQPCLLAPRGPVCPGAIAFTVSHSLDAHISALLSPFSALCIWETSSLFPSPEGLCPSTSHLHRHDMSHHLIFSSNQTTSIFILLFFSLTPCSPYRLSQTISFISFLKILGQVCFIKKSF